MLSIYAASSKGVALPVRTALLFSLIERIVIKIIKESKWIVG